jgi:hypothetical protein
MNQRPRRSIASELENVEEALAALSQQVAELRLLADTELAVPPRTPLIGDRVRFLISGVHAEGVIIGITRRRVQIRQLVTNHFFSRAPHNITLL